MLRLVQRPLKIVCDSCHWDGGVWEFEEETDENYTGMHACIYCGWFERWFHPDSDDLMVGYMGLDMFNKARARAGRMAVKTVPVLLRKDPPMWRIP